MRVEKQYFLDEIKEIIETASAMVFMSYKNLQANETAQFRQQLLDVNGSFRVVPKRIFIKAADASGIALKDVQLVGHLGIITTQKDPIDITKTLVRIASENTEKMEILGGHVEGRLCSPSEIMELSKLPGINQMRAEFIGILQAPLSQTLAVFEALLTSVAYCLENKGKQGS